jgi:hypothetical protein
MNAFYYYYFLSKQGVEIPTPEEEWSVEALKYMTSPKEVSERAAGSLGISELWLTSVPVVFTKRTFALYVGAGKLSGGLVPSSDGILFKNGSSSATKAITNISSGYYEPLRTPPPMPYALMRAAAEMKQVDVASYIRTNFRYDDKEFTDSLIRDVILAGAYPPSGSMEHCDHGVISDFAKVEDITVDEACSGFEVKDENCFVNLLIAFKLCVSNFSVKYNKDGSMLISYPGYKLSDFTQEVVATQNRPEHRGGKDAPVYGIDYV